MCLSQRPPPKSANFFVLCSCTLLLCITATAEAQIPWSQFYDPARSYTARLWQNVADVSQMVQKDAAVVWERSVRNARQLAACPIGECCVPQFIKADLDGLHRNLTAELYGQHIVIDVLTKALRAHYAAGAPTSSKPLVISLHGQSGTGKTFVAQRLVEHLYHLGMRSRFVRHYIGRSSFPTAQHLAEYQRLVAGQVRDTVRQCERALFVFDEMDKMPAGILDGMASVLGHYEHIDGVDYRRATFVFISNSHGEEIAELLRGWQLRGAGREAVRPVHFEAELKLIAYNAGGLRGSSVISEDLVDHYVPFLPLERRHVRQCVRREFGRHGKAATDALVDRIVAEAATYNGNYSISGCKRIDKAVAFEAAGI